jgi:hypothetical protein
MTYDAARGQVVLVGGLDGNGEPSFVGTKIAYLAPHNEAGDNSVWQPAGRWSIRYKIMR